MMSVNKIYAPAVSVAMQGVAYGPLGEDAVAVAPATPLPIYSPGGLLAVSAAFVRPADTAPYAIGDLVANSTSAGSVVALELSGAFRAGGEALRIERARLRKTGPALSNAAFRVHLFRAQPSATVGDNGVFDNGSGFLALSDIAGYVGTVDVSLGYAAANGARGVGVPSVGTGITCESTNASGHETSLWALIEARAAYAPASSETLTLTLEAARS